MRWPRIEHNRGKSIINLRCFYGRMSETVTISREEYDRLKRLEIVDHELIGQFKESLEDVKHGRIRRVA